ncbi:MAG: hypothetical protein LKI58_11355 [Actinomyces sp.]|jgi:ribose transport system permease protein|nr:hypothetical protein [Actinomyces sp.]MCI1642506.1 hypothetical protein [Actinomyces sp.]MCI1663061.1 hypothetical protein [Actinomyces sp.]MCI1691699.1 hypothetical protein [Actinomyces sp.]MCI1788634.1 hypothetical protein [Actinomyces sp.]MCI1829736.1 hypothetical protein [Actinomyces sp.]
MSAAVQSPRPVAPAGARTPGRPSAATLTRLAPLGLALLLLAVLAIRTPAALSGAALASALTQAAPIAVIGMALSLVIIARGDDAVTGGIDLSLAATAALASAVLTKALAEWGVAFPQALLLVVALAVAVGAINAGFVEGIGLTPILATLATSVLVSGVIRVVTTNRRTTTDAPVIVAIRDSEVLGVPVAILVAALVLLVLHALVHWTAFGARLRAVGGNRDASEVSGLRPRPYVVAAFLAAAAIAGLDGVLLTARASGFSPGMEDQLLVDMVLVAYLSPVFSRRATVTPLGAFLSAILVAVLSNSLILARVDNSWVYGVKGALILAVVVASALSRGRR